MRIHSSLADQFIEQEDKAIVDSLMTATVAEMSVKGKQGKTGYHIAAEKHIVVPERLLNEAVLCIQDEAGDTPLHYYAKWPLISLLPHKHINERTLFVKNLGQRTPFHEFAYHQNFCVVPEKLKTLANLLTPDDRGRTAIHEAAGCSKIESVPTMFLTQEVLSTTTKNGSTVFHALVKGDCLDKIPEKLITVENLTTRNRLGQIPLHLGSLRTVPKHLLTRDVLLIESTRESDKGWNVMHHSAELEGFRYIPKECLTFELLTRKTKEDLLNKNDCLTVVQDLSWLEDLPVYNEIAASTMSVAERQAWERALIERDLPVPAHLMKDVAHLSKQGAWQEL